MTCLPAKNAFPEVGARTLVAAGIGLLEDVRGTLLENTEVVELLSPTPQFRARRAPLAGAAETRTAKADTERT